MKRTTGVQRIREWFKTHKYLTAYQARRVLKVEDPRSRIAEMPDITKEKMIPIKCDGHIAWVARYIKVCDLV